jgi:hypothetical protein
VPARGIRAAGWHAELEVAGDGWRADVHAASPDGQRRTAWEAQLACAVPKLAVQALSWHFSTKDMVGLRGGAVQIERQGR